MSVKQHERLGSMISKSRTTLVTRYRRCRGFDRDRDGLAGRALHPTVGRHAHTLDAQADLVECPRAQRGSCTRPRVRDDRSPDTVPEPPAIGPFSSETSRGTMLRPSFPRLSLPRLAQDAIAFIARRVPEA